MDSYYKLTTFGGLGYIYPARTFKGETEIVIDFSDLVGLTHPIIKIEINFTDDTDSLVKTFSFTETNKLESDLIKHTFHPSVDTYNVFYYPTITITYLDFSVFKYQMPIKIAQNSFFKECENLYIGNAQFLDDTDNSVFVVMDTAKGNIINKLILSKSLPIQSETVSNFKWVRQHNNNIINEHETASFVVSAVYNDEPVSYTWFRKDGLHINTLNYISNVLTIPNAQISDTMVYYCVASVTTTDPITSRFASLQVIAVPVKPSVALQPISQTVSYGSSVVLYVNATGTAPLAYQWRINGIDDPSATNSTYIISNIRYNISNITCRVTNSAGSVISDPANITIV